MLGKRGARIKAIGEAARTELAELLGVPVHLFLHVKVEENWAEAARSTRRSGWTGCGEAPHSCCSTIPRGLRRGTNLARTAFRVVAELSCHQGLGQMGSTPDYP